MLKDIPAQVYSGISFEKGVLPNLSILEGCFIEDGLLINNKGDMPVIKRVSDYTKMIKDNIDNGNIISILESELKNEVRVFGKVAQIASEYQLVFEGKSGVQTRYGVNLFQLVLVADKWLITSMCWDDKTDHSLLTVRV
jgi:hypothetical protein